MIDDAELEGRPARYFFQVSLVQMQVNASYSLMTVVVRLSRTEDGNALMYAMVPGQPAKVFDTKRWHTKIEPFRPMESRQYRQRPWCFRVVVRLRDLGASTA
ncbi:hypothetical protein ElyMa_000926300 [Elysia marginata]|uniref:Uncharacterized protein n=1 Tax=Elysia marginata TaxID=1093978 RepID=A0AAV4HCE0_9GAST|nr:hypothetical protein ElyMa_000926300 [Elysia marginata]